MPVQLLRTFGFLSLTRRASWYQRKLHRSCPALHSAAQSTASLGGMADRLVWVDMEMTGLDVEKEHILEMACLVTDQGLNIVAEGPDVIVHQPDMVLDAMGEWCKENHGKSGLTAASRSSHTSLEEMEQLMLAFVQQHVPRGKCPLAGNTIHMDRRFLDKYMPRFMEHMHYRLVDVSTVKELCRRWYPSEFGNAPTKVRKHRALDDIKESIAEMQYYRRAIFK